MLLMARNWWAVLIRGVVAVVFGILVLVWPSLTLAVLVALFGAYALIDGVALIGLSLRLRSMQQRGDTMRPAY